MTYFWAILLLAIDQGAKLLIQTRMEIGESIPVFGPYFQLTFHRNPGAAWGMLAGQRWFLAAIGVIAIVAISAFLRRVSNRWLRLGLVFILGGAMGNTIDRILWGSVVDFFDIRIIQYPIFNTADVFLVFGVVLAIMGTWRDTRKEDVADGS